MCVCNISLYVFVGTEVSKKRRGKVDIIVVTSVCMHVVSTTLRDIRSSLGGISS